MTFDMLAIDTFQCANGELTSLADSLVTTRQTKGIDG